MFEERIIYALVIVVGLPVFAIAAASGAPIGAGPTLAGVLGVAGCVGIWRSRRRDPEIPRARSRKR